MIWYFGIGFVVAVIVAVVLVLGEMTEPTDETPTIAIAVMIAFLAWPAVLWFAFTWALIAGIKSIFIRKGDRI